MGRAGPVLRTACLALILLATALNDATAKNFGGFLQATRLVVEIPKLEPCPFARNALVPFNVENKMINKVDFEVNVDFNITRSATSMSELIVKITKCRDIVSANTCELFQTWRFDRNPCKAVNDPNAIWKSLVESIKPSVSCPIKVGSYSLRNYSMPTTVLKTLPLPWEGNVWQFRFITMESGKVLHTCTDSELKIHRVRVAGR